MHIINSMNKQSRVCRGDFFRSFSAVNRPVVLLSRDLRRFFNDFQFSKSPCRDNKPSSLRSRRTGRSRWRPAAVWWNAIPATKSLYPGFRDRSRIRTVFRISPTSCSTRWIWYPATIEDGPSVIGDENNSFKYDRTPLIIDPIEFFRTSGNSPENRKIESSQQVRRSFFRGSLQTSAHHGSHVPYNLGKIVRSHSGLR